MLTVLLLIGQASSEWVEISQQHHIKPLRPASALNIHKDSDGIHTTLEKTTGANRIYLNNSLPDHGWNKYNNFQPSKDYANRLSDDIYRNTESYVIREDTYHDEEEKSDNVRIKTKLSNNKVSFDKNVEDATKGFVTTYKHQLTTTYRPLRIQATDIYKGKPIEVADLSDLEHGHNEDVFSTVKLKDDLKFMSFKDVNNRLTVNVSPKPEPMKALHKDYKWKSNTNNRTNSIFLNTDVRPKTENRPLQPVTETSTSPTFEKTAIQSNINNDFILTDKQNNKNEPKSEVHESKDVIDIKHVHIVNESTNYAQTTANNIKEFNILKTEHEKDSFENDEMDPNSNKKITNIGEIKPFQTNLVPFKKIDTLNPEEVMIKEILQDEVKGNDQRQTAVAPNKIPDVKIQENEERISNPDYTAYKTHNHGIVKRLNHSGVQEEIFKIFKMKEKSTNLAGPTFVSDTSTSTPKINNNIMHDKVDRELAGVYMNEDVEIIKHVLVTSTEEIPIRTTVKVKPFTKTNIEEANSYSDEHSKYSPIISMTENKSQEEKKNHERDHEFMKNKQNVIIMKQRNPYKKDETQKYADDAPAASPHDFEVKESTEKNKNNTEGTEESVTKDKNADTMKNLIKFLRIVTDTISQNTRKSFKGKLQYLEDLRDTIMANIEDRIDSAFPDDEGPKRRGRSATARGQHVEFPSAESALMTISFLTFAVYLIKLVLQVIHTYKNKTMMVPAVMAAVGRVYQATRS